MRDDDRRIRIENRVDEKRMREEDRAVSERRYQRDREDRWEERAADAARGRDDIILLQLQLQRSK